MKDEPGDQGPPSQSPLNIDQVRNLIVVERRVEPDIPEGKGRPCPQCRRTAWRESRFCWNCKFDFDRAELPRCHPRKLLIVAVSVIFAGLVAVVIAHHNGNSGANPTPHSSGSTPTPSFARAGTLEPSLGREHERRTEGRPLEGLGGRPER